MIHFAPDSAKSETLEVNNIVLYPLPAGTKPVVREWAAAPPPVVNCRFTSKDSLVEVCTGVHQIYSDPGWAPDSRHIAILHRIYDIKQEWSTESGTVVAADELRSQMYAVVVALDGRFRRLQLPSLSWEEIQSVRLEWTSNSTLRVRLPTGSLSFAVPGSLPR